MTKRERIHRYRVREEEALVHAWSKLALVAGSLWMLSLWILVRG